MLLRGRTALLALASAPYVLMAVAGSQSKPTYSADVLPVLKAHCASCHSGDSPSAGLDLTTVAGVKRAIRPKDSKNSSLIQRLRGIGGARMPMGFAPLPKETIDKIALWIDAGAPFDAVSGKHWAYVAPVKPKVPHVSGRLRNPIDAFVADRLAREGLKPTGDAPPEKLLRRVYLDLIGIPPTPQEIDAFLADRRPDAYERVVDSLLKNPHYGERQAEPWLDLSRYADSDGYEKDLNRTAWKYRDWLIDAFNRNLPYDRFTIEQLAGDLLPNPTTDQLVATGFNRNTMFNREGGVDQEEAHFNVILDRVGTTATVWLGSTLQCARCHNHKYDPFTQRDFYRMAAFFSDSSLYPVGSKAFGEENWFEAQISVPTPQEAASESKLKAEVSELDRRIRTWSPELAGAYATWLEGIRKGPAWKVLQAQSATSKNGAALSSDGSGAITSAGKLPATDDYTIAGKARLSRISGLSIEAIASDSLPGHGPGRSANGNFVISKVRLTVGGKAAKFSRAAADFDQRQFEGSRVLGTDPNSGWAIDGAEGKSHEIVLDLAEPIEAGPETPVEVVIEQHWPGGEHLLGKFRISLTSTPDPTTLSVPPKIRELASTSPLNDAGTAALQDQFRKVTPLLDGDRMKLASVKKDLAMLESQIPTALVMRDKPHKGPLTAYVHSRGEFLSPTDLVTAGYPSALSSEPDDSPEPAEPSEHGSAKAGGADPAPVPHINANGDPRITGKVLTRLDLAQWLVSRRNPLTARVEVNRLWEQFFGRGLVETSEDFGTQGSRPSHPELLDWLACEFMDRGWDMKAMVRLIVTSSTYRRSSDASAALMEKDPQNVLLARGPRVRLDAETIRDTVLSASGLLSRKIGGPSVFPSQPAGVWDTPYNGEQWMESKGEDRYRRGMYTFVKRSSPYPSFLDFDSTSRESCTVRRIRTNTPLQALAMLNDEAVLEAARALGSRMLRDGGRTSESRLTYGFRLCTGRRPDKAELARLQLLYDRMLSRYTKDPAAAGKLLEVAPKTVGSAVHAAYAMVGNVLLNLDETVTKG